MVCRTLYAVLCDVSDICCAISRVGLADVRRIRRRSGAHAARLITRAEIMGALERDVVRWIGCSKEEKSRRYHCADRSDQSHGG